MSAPPKLQGRIPIVYYKGGLPIMQNNTSQWQHLSVVSHNGAAIWRISIGIDWQSGARELDGDHPSF